MAGVGPKWAVASRSQGRPYKRPTLVKGHHEMRQRTLWLMRVNYRKGHYVRAGIVNNLKPTNDPDDVIRLQTKWVDGDIDWTMRIDEAMALVDVLGHAVSVRLTDVEWETKKRIGH